MSRKESEATKKTSIGGQAVIEGVMMRGKTSMVTAVRDSDGIIRVERKRLYKNKKPTKLAKIPLIRGVVNFIDSMYQGSQTLMRSAEVFGEGEPSKFEKWLANKFKIDVMKVITFISLVLGLGLAIVLFMWLPQFLRQVLEHSFSTTFDLWAKNFIEGGLKLLIFISYILLSSILKDIRRTFMYHGAEHKTIACFEHDLELTVENAKKCKRVHDRCGTTFMVFVILISILVFALVEALVGTSIDNIYRVLLKIALLPVVAGLSYELLKGLSKTNFFLLYPLKIPGLLLQRVTTREPSDDMLEVAIVAFKGVIEMDNDQSIEETSFVVALKRKDLVNKVKVKLADNGIDEDAEAEWIVSIALDIKRDQVYSDKLATPKQVDKVNQIVEQRITGRPLWYCIGDTDFYGYTIKVDERVLIPRPETELLVENALKHITRNSQVLDLCTGSGVIAIAVNKQSSAKVTAIDISSDAISLAKENADYNGADIEFIQSDMFENLTDKKFDVIISNPPYIKKQDLNFLQKEVKDFEPMLALDGGEDGFDFYRNIAKNSIKYLNEKGVLLLECGFDQAKIIAEMLQGFTSVEIIKDYENIDRIVKAVL